MSTTTSRRKILLGMASLAASGLALSEQCWQVGGCKNSIGWFRVNKLRDSSDPALDIQRLFGVNNLPRVDSILVIRRRAILRDLLNLDVDDRELQLKDEAPWTDGDQSIAAGTKIRVLGYYQRLHLFVLVQILEESRDPYKNQKKYKFDFDYVI